MDKVFEENVLACYFRLKDFCAISSAFLRPAHFSGSMEHNMFKIASDFYKKYGTIISKQGFIDSLASLVKRNIVAREEISAYIKKYERFYALQLDDNAYVLDKLTEFIKTKEIKSLIEDSITRFLPKGDLESIESGFSKILDISTSVDIEPVSFFSQDRIKQRFERREREKREQIQGITTGIRKLDDLLYKRGWNKRELIAILGDSKAGKTQFMLWLANAAAWAGYRVGYWTFETATEILEDRLDALNTVTEIKNVTLESKAICEKMMNSTCPGDIVFYEYPTKSVGPRQVKIDLEKEKDSGKAIEFAIFDYCDIMRSDRKYDSKWDEQVAVVEDIRALLGRPDKGGFDIPGITGMQIGQKGSGKQIVGAEDGAGAYEKIAVVDGALTISGDQNDRQNEELYINLSRFRNAPVATIKIKTDYSRGRFYKDFVQSAL